ncbi:molybdopterin cofactor-binding domain-containing protein [Paraburkholderia fungorum]|uniref:molybdopterin cofactor-binding domain-containing protein n=1 Tax=Paraburkholderia fungorum TaxID=134537 RepID=UPI0020938D23|nr:molybdopterin cofactor-binding domain-containing protein [Paraburkholderia fungorum]USU20801.1 molybdopterin-dependent oxidoreductase [Paraburkholderia fungorum]USU27202.1 molybdopterin-dependent oxidoreductase [Paraburkholderia fungorum]
MTGPDFSVDRRAAPPSRQHLYDAQSVLLVTRPPQPPVRAAIGQPGSRSTFVPTQADTFLVVRDDGSVVAFNGHVDLGTGIGTALAQIVAEELDVPLTRVSIVLGHTNEAPNQGPTIASATIQISAVPLRHAAAQARQFLLAEAAARLKVDAAQLDVRDGVIFQRDDDTIKGLSYGELIAGRRIELTLATDAPLKSPDTYRIVGKSSPRVDIPAKATGELSFVHDVRVPGMLHGRVVRPPYAGIAQGEFIGNSLLHVDEDSLRDLPGIVKVVVIRDFVGIVAEREEIAQQAVKRLAVRWKTVEGLPPLETSEEVEAALRANPASRRDLVIEGDTDAALAQDPARTVERTYVWPFQMHASIGPSCAVADYREGTLKVWSGTQNPHSLRADLALLMALDEAHIEIVRMEAAGCYGRNCADDVAADAALLSRATGSPVRVQLSREDEHAWEPKGAAQLMDVRGALGAQGELAGYDFATRYPSNDAPTLALLLTGTLSPQPQVFEMGDRTAVPPYDYRTMRIVCDDTPPIVRASWLRGVSALPNTFAHESFIDELAAQAGADPVEFRLKHLTDPRAMDLVKAVAEKAGWQPRPAAFKDEAREQGDVVRGRGFAYARYVHSKFPGFGAAWSAWVADVEVNRRSGELAVTRVVVGQDTGTMVNPDGVRHQIHGNVIQATSRALKERVTFGENAVTSQEWGAYPILTFREVPVIDVVMMPRHGEPPMGTGESASLPGAAAIANALYDATGVRFRRPPFTPETIRAALADAQAQDAAARSRKRWRFGFLGALAAGAAGWLGALSMSPAAIAPIAPPLASAFAPELVARGKLLASLGNCAVCHTAHNGVPNAGGKPLDTPFGTVYSTNITPDGLTGIGTWSLDAFVRAMRQGISRDGHRLYPAFPYTSFKNTSDDDLKALYAYLMAQTPVRSRPPETKLAYPFSVRPLMAVWNGLFLGRNPLPADATQSAQWNRGAYLVNGLGHCSACHTPRNAFGAEKTGAAFMGGGMADGWEAPALSTLSNAPVPWSEDELFSYLRYGHAPLHGVAAGPMAPVVNDLAALPDSDIRAMATYLASLNPLEANADPAAMARQYEQASTITGTATGPGARLFDGACAACHHTGSGPQLFGAHPSLALNTNLHSATPDNLIRVILDGIGSPARPELGTMPAYRDSFNDAQVAELVSYLRQQFAGGKPAWQDVTASVARIRAAPRAE